MDPITLTLNPRDRLTLSTTIERLIGLLDNMEGDPDSEDGADEEPWLGAPERHPEPSRLKERKPDSVMHSQETWASGDAADHEEACEDEGAQCDDEGAHPADDEYSLGWTEEVDQVRRLEHAPCSDDKEPDLGWAESHGKGIVGDQNCLDDREHDNDDLEPEIDGADIECCGESPAPIAGGGSVSQNEDGWRPSPDGPSVAPVKLEKLTPPTDEVAQSVIRERDAVRNRRRPAKSSSDDERFGFRVPAGALTPELKLPLAGGVPQLRASDFDRLPWAD